MSRLLEKLLPVRPGERRLAAVMFLHNFSAVGAFIAGRSVRDALFLSHAGASGLALMYVLSALGVAVTGLLYAPFAAHFRRDLLASWSALLFAGLFGAAWAQSHGAPRWLYPALYIYVEVMGAIALVQFWTLLNELFHAREARRLYGPIGAGGMVANIVVGLATRGLAKGQGADAILLLCAGLCVGIATSTLLAGRLGRERLVARAAAGAAVTARGGAGRVWRSGHLRTVAALGAITFVTTTCVDFEFKAMAGRALAQDQLAAYFGGFYALVGVLALGLQLFGTGQVLNRLGVVSALAVLPASLAVGNLTLALFGTLWAAALAKGADSLFRYSINDATTQLLYLPVAPHGRARAKAFIDGVVKSAAIAFAGLLLLVFREWFRGTPEALAYLTLGLCALWGTAVAAIRKGYIRSLQENLRHRRADAEGAGFPVQEGSAHRLLVQALDAQEPNAILGALELLDKAPELDVDERVERLLEHPLAEVRVGALTYFARRQAVRHANAIFRCFEDREPSVRAVAIETFCTLGRDKAIRTVRGFLQDPDPAVRSAAIVGMIRFGGLDGVLSAAEALKALLGHEHSAMRLHAAKVLGAIGVKNFYQPVLELMNDPEPAVRRQAIQAAGVLQSPEFVLPLIYKTRSPETGAEAVEALCAYGPAIAASLGKVLGNALEDLAVRRSVARVLGRMGSPEAIELLLPHLGEQDDGLRTCIDRALVKAARSRRLSAQDRRRVESALELDILRAYRALAAAEGLGVDGAGARGAELDAGALLGSALADKVAQAEERIFLLLGVLYPEAGMEHIWLGIRDAAESFAARRRANAVELLDNLLERNLKRLLLPLIDELPRAEQLEAVRDRLSLGRPTPDALLAELCRDENAWVRACALFYAASCQHPDAAQAALACAADPDLIVRETALVASARLRPQEAAQLAEQRLQDESDTVRRLAEAILRAA